MFSFAYDSVVDRSEPQKLKYLLNAATEFNCELRYRNLDIYPLETSEGYAMHRYIISAINQKDWEAFASNISKNIPDIKWFPLSPEHQIQIIYQDGFRLPSLQEETEISPIGLNSRIDSWPSVASYNTDLKQKLEKETPLYFTYDWVLPSSEGACRIWLETLLEALWKLSLGCTIRLSGELKPYLNMYIQTLVLRVFALEELEALKQRISFDSTNGDWQNAPADVFFKANPIYIVTIGSFLAQIK